MGNQTVAELRKKSDAAWGNLSRQLQGMEPYIDRSDAPGEWTTREVLSHLLFEAGFDPSQVQRPDASGHDAVPAAHGHQRVPELLGVARVHPELEPEVAGVAGAGHRDRHAGDRHVNQVEILERLDGGSG